MALTAGDLHGAWRLLSSVTSRNGVDRPSFGNPPEGQIQYTGDGRMSAFLMDPAWAVRGDVAADSSTDFFAYGGTWTLDGAQVCHTIAFASVPRVVGTVFERTVDVIDADTIALLTAPETTRSGTVYVTRLVWRRVGAV